MQRQTLVYCLKAMLDSLAHKKTDDDVKSLLGEWMVLFGDVDDATFTDATRIIVKKNTFFPSPTEMRSAISRADMIKQGRILEEIKRKSILKKTAEMTEEDKEAYAWLFSHNEAERAEMRKLADEMVEDAKRELAGGNRITGGAIV